MQASHLLFPVESWVSLDVYCLLDYAHGVVPPHSEGDRSGKCPPGFVAIDGLRSPVALDFYLQSHGGLLGSE